MADHTVGLNDVVKGWKVEQDPNAQTLFIPDPGLQAVIDLAKEEDTAGLPLLLIATYFKEDQPAARTNVWDFSYAGNPGGLTSEGEVDVFAQDYMEPFTRVGPRRAYQKLDLGMYSNFGAHMVVWATLPAVGLKLLSAGGVFEDILYTVPAQYVFEIAQPFIAVPTLATPNTRGFTEPPWRRQRADPALDPEHARAIRAGLAR